MPDFAFRKYSRSIYTPDVSTDANFLFIFRDVTFLRISLSLFLLLKYNVGDETSNNRTAINESIEINRSTISIWRRSISFPRERNIFNRETRRDDKKDGEWNDKIFRGNGEYINWTILLGSSSKRNEERQFQQQVTLVSSLCFFYLFHSYFYHSYIYYTGHSLWRIFRTNVVKR